MTTPHHDALDLVRLTATAVLAVQAHQDAGLAVPYPPAAQLALDRITAVCLLEGLEAPASVPALLALCRAHLSKWPITVPSDYTGPDAVLVDEATGLPTHVCAEWASGDAFSSGVGPINELLRQLAGNCPSPGIYERCRSFLIDHPVVNQENMRAVHSTPGGSETWKRVQPLYGPVAHAYARDGQCVRCASCRCLAVTLPDKTSRCESGVCPGFTAQQTEPVTALRALPAELRHPLSASGRVERDIRNACLAAGAHVELRPDAVDHLRITWPSDDLWLVVVSTSAEPALLARRLRHWTPDHASRVCVAVPGYVMERRPDYRQVFERHRRPGSAELIPAELVASSDQHQADGGEPRA
ncbi:hypothetical protein [Micromonospora sp. HUAS LYJ1]|uniref:pPIWI_RE_Y domain-containing protein n=1 Tax=Micromonospora sp. HUAS LYJ1 TaxID=3061626 RepID=UPI002672F0B9|nr:hypothetical protein [Micromonospora sp. HUAS LYJ1]WKU03979.1 hypothetical protein Q2K16_24560 [Micromonospora sp. HUAS LYJ1]